MHIIRGILSCGIPFVFGYIDLNTVSLIHNIYFFMIYSYLFQQPQIATVRPDVCFTVCIFFSKYGERLYHLS